MKKLIALSLALVMMFALAACGGEGGSESANDLGNVAGGNKIEWKDEVVNVEIPEGKAIPDNATLKVTIASHESWPYDQNWAVWKYIKESIGGDLQVTAIPSSDFGTKFPLLMTDDENRPDVFGFQGKPSGFSSYCAQGAFVSLDQCEEFMPDYNAFWDGLPEEDQWMKDTRKTSDGQIYYSPVYGVERSTNIRAWLYRKDIFEKNNLKTPETMDDLYKVAKKLKALYPDSYPLCMRSGLANIGVIGCSWKPNFHYGVYYDFENATWSYGAREETMREIVEFFNKMVREGLVPPNFTTIKAGEWEELVATNRGFMMPEYQVRMDHFNLPARKSNPEFTLAVMTPPHADNGVGIAKVNKYNNDPTGMAICNNNDQARTANAARYINWFYTDEAAELVSWGKEGESYSVDAEGKKDYILGTDEKGQTKYGFKTIGTYCRIDPASIDVAISAEQAATTDIIVDEYTYEYLDPTLYIQMSDEDSTALSELNTSIDAVVQEGISKFVTGQRSMKEWDAFQQELAGLAIDDVLAIYEKYEVIR